MKKILAVILCMFLFLVGCSEKKNELIRIDFEKAKKNGSYGDKIVVTDKDVLNSINAALETVKWEKNTKPSMARVEDVKARFFYEVGNKDADIGKRTGESNKFTDYLFWFNREIHMVTIISSDKNESYGILKGSQASKLIEALSNIEKDILREIESSLSKIISSPAESSNPDDYVKMHQEEFDFIVKQGDLTLNHFFNEFSKSRTDGLKEYIMALSCIKILGTNNPVNDWSTGREWYEKYKSR